MSVPSTGMIAKALAATAVSGLGAYAAALPDGVTPAEVVGVAVTTLVALGAVWAVPNTPKPVRRYGKAIVAALVGAGGPIGTGLADGVLTQTEIVTAVIALIVGAGLTGAVPNAGVSAGLGPGHGLEHYDDLTDGSDLPAEVWVDAPDYDPAGDRFVDADGDGRPDMRG